MDIREKPYIDNDDLRELNFIRYPAGYVFRRHYRCGMRSHIMEILDPCDVQKETHGILIDGIRCFPKARPIKMLRLFRTKFKALAEAFEEIGKVKLIEAYLTAEHFANSVEFLVDYVRSGRRGVMLCGLQEYVSGEILDPWGDISGPQLAGHLLCSTGIETPDSQKFSLEVLQGRIHANIESFVDRVKKMIHKSGHVPDLAGEGNLIITPRGNVKLVDINNISRVCFDSTINLDDKGYPVCDKSIEAVALLESKLLGRSIDMQDRIYRRFLEPRRMRDVFALEQDFRGSLKLAQQKAGLKST